MNITQGCLQEEPSLPLMSNIGANKLLKELTHTRVKVKSYLDDKVSICRDKYKNTLYDKIPLRLKVTATSAGVWR